VESLRGQLLIAAPSIDDPNFARTVILVAHHDGDGAMGVILNRPADHVVGDAVPELADVVGDDEAVFVGGPVQPDGVMVLAEFDDPEAAALPVLAGLGFVALGTHGEHIADGTRRARAFAGHAGWGPGQLEDELEEEAWIVASFVPEDAFTAEPEDLWSEVLTRKGGAYALVAKMPLDPSLN
jgi:putative transcriptional regulator